MKNYYYYMSSGIKMGPFKLKELKEHIIFDNTLVWSKQSDEWKKASEYEELLNCLFSNPEAPISSGQLNIRHFIEIIFIRYVVFSFFLTILVTFIMLISLRKYDSNISKRSYVDFWFRAYNDILNFLTDSTVYISHFENQTPILNLTGKMLLSTFASNIPVFIV